MSRSQPARRKLRSAGPGSAAEPDAGLHGIAPRELSRGSLAGAAPDLLAAVRPTAADLERQPRPRHASAVRTGAPVLARRQLAPRFPGRGHVPAGCASRAAECSIPRRTSTVDVAPGLRRDPRASQRAIGPGGARPSVENRQSWGPGSPGPQRAWRQNRARPAPRRLRVPEPGQRPCADTLVALLPRVQRERLATHQRALETEAGVSTPSRPVLSRFRD